MFEFIFGVIRCICDFWRPCIRETASRRAKRTNIWASTVSIQCRVFLTVKCQFGVIRCITDFGRPCISETAVLERNGPTFGHLGQVFSVYTVLLTFKCSSSSLWPFGAFPIFGQLVSWKKLFGEWNGPKFGPQWWVFSVYKVHSPVECSSSVWGYSMHFRFLPTLWSRKRLVVGLCG